MKRLLVIIAVILNSLYVYNGDQSLERAAYTIHNYNLMASSIQALNAIDINRLPTVLMKYPATNSSELGTDIQLIAQDLENEVYLYGLFQEENGNAKGILLRKQNKIQYFNWSYSTSQKYPPTMNLADFDGDKDIEIGIVLTTGAGPSLLFQELHIVDFGDEEEMIDSSPNTDSLLALIENDVRYTVNENNGEILLTLKGQTINVTSPYPVDRIVFPNSNNIGYAYLVDGNQILFSTSIAIIWENNAIPRSVATITLFLDYCDAVYTISDCSIKEIPLR